MKPVFVALAFGLMLSACGGQTSASERLTTASATIHDIRSGELSLALSMGSDQADGSVGFSVSGPFSFDSGTALPVADLTFVQRLGNRTLRARFVSDGTRAYAVRPGRAPMPLTPQQLGDLDGFMGEQGAGGLPGMDLNTWITEPSIEGRGSVAGDPTILISGPVDVATALSGLFSLMSNMGAPSSVPLPDENQRALLNDAAHSTEMTVEVGADDGLLRHLSLKAVFGLDPSSAPALAELADAHLDFEMTISNPGDPISVQAPV